ncbi:MAG TPA: GH92 family glycosyl hydrolase [Ferruginibacter sp.]|nr:GH92 family glycosyl hydrolase [Ferruginibacter sp.]
MAQKPNNKYVNPLIGTQKMGHTFPGATVPFGMVQLSPDTDTIQFLENGKYNPDVYKYCGGYQYDDKTIVGFSHTHFSGTGHSDLGDFLIMPTVGILKLNPGVAAVSRSGYRSAFSHENEKATAGYYSVLLDDYKIKAELTATERVGFHQYTFPESNEAHIILDLVHGIYNYPEKNVWTFVRIENDTLITGYRQTMGWARTRTVYFAMAFSRPMESYGSSNSKKDMYNGFWGKFNQKENFPDLAGRQLKLYFNFKTTAGEKIKIKMALSGTGTDGALKNLRAEIPHWDFEKTVAGAAAKWDNELSKVTIDAPEDIKINFYTSMYHAFIAPNTFMDVDGNYKGLDQDIHQANGFVNYTTFSLWDTYRALHPLYNILQTKRNGDMVKSMLSHYNQSALHMLPIWSHYANDNWCMSGYHSVSVVADAIIKGNTGIDANAALAACVTTARKRNYEGIGDYITLGYIPANKSGVSVSNTLEYAYDDWAIAQLAKKAGNTAIYNEFMLRSANYKNVFDKDGFVKAKDAAGKFINNFDPLSTSGQGLIEGNSWNYSFFVPHNPPALITIMGGTKKFISKMDSLFTMYLPDKYFAETEDITREGIIGTYVHGNEPAHHVGYLYNFAGVPWKTQEIVRTILHNQYKPTPDGLGGNDDCGQMSAWYIFSALGFYPVTPGSDEYQIGSPVINSALIHLENGKQLKITVKNQSEENKYVKSVSVNGKPITGNALTHHDIVSGGEIIFVMSNKHANE